MTLTTANTDKKVGTKQVVIEDDEFVSIQELLSNLTNKIIEEGKFSAKFNDLLRITITTTITITITNTITVTITIT